MMNFDRDWDFGDQFATTVREAINKSMSDSDRSRYAQQQRIGVSDIGTCREYARRMISGEEWTDTQDNYAAAFLGTAIGEFAENAMKDLLGDEVRTQVDVTVNIDVRGYALSIPGHVDVVGADFITDFKTKDGLGVVRRTGPSQQQMFQVTLYAKALIDAGELPEDCTVSLTYVDRSGREPDPVVFAWTFDEAIYREAVEWLDDVIYAIENNEEASKDQPRNWCFECCQYATACRGTDTDVQGLIDDPVVIEAVDVYQEANATIRAAEKDKKSAMSVLTGVAGSTGKNVIRWINIPGGRVEYDRAEYQRIDIRPVPKRKEQK